MNDLPDRWAVPSRGIQLKSCELYLGCGKPADRLREDDVSWPKKNIVGKQELEVRIDNELISFEVSMFSLDQVAVGN